MKTLLVHTFFVAAVVCAAGAQARDIAVTTNDAGGIIVLTNDQNKDCRGGQYGFYATNADASMGLKGCYILKGSEIIMKSMYAFDNGKVQKYENYNSLPLDDFEMIPE